MATADRSMFRTAYALIGSTVLTTGLGMAASIAAARLYSVEEVGRGQSAVNALIILAGLGNLRLMNVLTRFLPRARERSAWLVGRCYLLAAVASVVACLVYLNLPVDVLPVSELLPGVPYAGVWFTLAVLAFALFTLQDAVLTGVRQATWVPLENGIHSSIKLAIVVVAAGSMPSTGIFASWVVPTVLALGPINLLIVRRLLPANAARPVTPERLEVRRLAGFTAGEYAGALCELAVTNLIPLLVAARLGLAPAGVFAVAWLIGTTLDHVVVHFGSSLTVEGAADPTRLAALTRELLRRSLAIVAPLAAVIVVGAPLLLRLFGPEYAERAGGLLSLLGLALLPRLVCTVAVVVARVRNQLGAVVGIQAALAAGTLAGTVPLLDRMGIAGPGVAYLVSSTVVAVAVTPRLLANLREARHLRQDAADMTTPAYGMVPVSPGHAPDLSHLSPRTFPRAGASAAAAAPARTFHVPGTEHTRPAVIPALAPAPAAPPRHARPGSDRSSRPHRLPARVVGASLALVVALGAVAVVQIDRSNPGGALGLVAVLPVTWWLALGVLTVSFARCVVVAPQRHGWLLAHVALLVVALHATPGLVEAHGRFPTAWTHVGFVDHVAGTGNVEPGYDARYDWPGAFSFGGFLVQLTGAESARALVRFAPVVLNLLLLAPLGLLARHVSRDNRVRWVGLWLVVLTNWVGQDYLAPQPVALLAYLAVIGVLLGWFRRPVPRPASPVDVLGRLRLHRRLRSFVRDERLNHTVAPAAPATAGQELGLVGAMAAIGAVIAFSHQLTPFMLVIAGVVLVVAGRVNRPLVPVLLAVCAVGWTGLGATDFLRSNLDTLTGAVGDVGGVVQEGQDRVGPGPARQVVLATRLVLTGLTVALAGWGFVRQWRARRADWALAGLAAAPVLLVLANNYGGEILLRVALFALPFLALLAAFGLVRERMSPHGARRAGVAVVAVSAVLLPLFVAARYGNESFERIYDDDIAAWDYLVDTAPAGSAVVVPDFAGPWRYRELLRFEYRVFADESGGHAPTPAALDALVVDEERPAYYLVLGTASAHYRTIAEGYPHDWVDTLTTDLLASGNYDLVFTSGETRVLERRPPRSSPAPPESTVPLPSPLPTTTTTPTLPPALPTFRATTTPTLPEVVQ